MTPIYQTLSRVRHDNRVVAGAVENGAGTREEIVAATGLTRVRVALALRRLECLRRVEWVDFIGWATTLSGASNEPA